MKAQGSSISDRRDLDATICPNSDDIAIRTCTQYLRHIWRLKLLIIVIACIVYVTCYIAVVTIQSRNHLPVGRALGERTPVRVSPSKNPMLRVVRGYTNVTQTLPPFFNTSFSFHRDDLRLHFRELSPVNSSRPFYDNKDKYRCSRFRTHRRLSRKDEVEDLWCLSRPPYIPWLKNPCFNVRANRRTATLPVLCVPYFHILGADKCGTTDFHSRLVEHPHILSNSGGLGKEVYYWCWLRFGIFMKRTVNYNWHFSWYLQAFRNASESIYRELNRSGMQLITGDGTPIDFWDFRGWQLEPQNKGKNEPEVLTPHAMRHMYKDPRFFVLMRDPVERLFSDYIFLGYGFSAAKFARDVPVAIAMMRDCLAVNTTRQCFFSDNMYKRMPMRLHISCYSIFLREWLSVFDRRHFFFLRTEDYHADTAGSLEAAFKFLGVEPLLDADLKTLAERRIRHVTTWKKQAGNIFPETRELLEEFYIRFNEDLAILLEDKRFLWKDSKSKLKPSVKASKI